MVLKYKAELYIERAENELRLAKAVFNISTDEKTKNIVGVNPTDTFYSAVITHCYYAIFYSAKSILTKEGMDTKAPEVHKKTFEKFKTRFVDTGKLDVELLKIYKKMIIRADELLHLFAHEKWKRGHFTYHTISQANLEPAKESIENAKKFVAVIKEVANS